MLFLSRLFRSSETESRGAAGSGYGGLLLLNYLEAFGGPDGV